MSILRRLHGPNARAPTPELASALFLHLATPTLSVMAVLPTGSGKTALIVADAVADAGGHGVVVVVVPLRALVAQTVRTCAQAGIPVEVFTSSLSQGLAPSTRVLVVSADLVPTDAYANLLGLLSDHGVLRRIVVDEVHMLQLASGFRPKLGRALKNLHGNAPDSVPVTFLSATVPPETAYELQLGSGIRTLHIVRAPSTRTNIELAVQRVPDMGAALAGCATVVQETLRSAMFEQRDKVIVFCMSIAQTNEAATSLKQAGVPDVVTYHSDLAHDQQEESANTWAGPDCRVMVATSGFGTGVSYAHVRLVVHLGGAYSTVDMVQELGRAGRDLRAARHVLIVRDKDQRQLHAAVLAYASATTGCRGQMLARDIDGAACLPCVLAGRVPCDLCRPIVYHEIANAADRTADVEPVAPATTPLPGNPSATRDLPDRVRTDAVSDAGPRASGTPQRTASEGRLGEDPNDLASKPADESQGRPATEADSLCAEVFDGMELDMPPVSPVGPGRSPAPRSPRSLPTLHGPPSPILGTRGRAPHYYALTPRPRDDRQQHPPMLPESQPTQQKEASPPVPPQQLSSHGSLHASQPTGADDPHTPRLASNQWQTLILFEKRPPAGPVPVRTHAPEPPKATATPSTSTSTPPVTLEFAVDCALQASQWACVACRVMGDKSDRQASHATKSCRHLAGKCLRCGAASHDLNKCPMRNNITGRCFRCAVPSYANGTKTHPCKQREVYRRAEPFQKANSALTGRPRAPTHPPIPTHACHRHDRRHHARMGSVDPYYPSCAPYTDINGINTFGNDACRFGIVKDVVLMALAVRPL